MKRVKRLLVILLTGVLLFSMSTFAYAKSMNLEAVIAKEKLQKAYENVNDYAYANGVPLDLSLDTFIEEFMASHATDITEYENTYYRILTARQTAILPNSSGGGKWYYNTGAALPRSANYSKYKLLDSVKKGDIIYESKGGFGITGHTAIVEGKYYSSTYQQYYIRVVEAITDGVVRSVLDDTRVDEKDTVVLRVKGATDTIIANAVNFCVGQLGKGYMIDFKKNTSASEPDWYCSELNWAGYYNQGIDIETTGLYNEPGITPRDINNSSKVSNVPFK